MSARGGHSVSPAAQPSRLAQVLRAGLHAGAARDATPTDAPEYFGLDENASGKLEDFLEREDVARLRSVNQASRRDTATLTLGDWRRNEDGSPRGPGEWNDYSWTASFSRGRDASGERVQYVAIFDDYKAIRGNEGGVPLGIRFLIQGDEIEFERYEDNHFPFADGLVQLNIPEWNLSGKYELDYGEQSVRAFSDVQKEEENGRRFFQIRIRMAVQSTTPKVYVSFGFYCRVDEDGEDGEAEEAEDSEDIEATVNTANWYLVGVTIYR